MPGLRTKLTNLTNLGVKKSKAWEWANTNRHVANSYILNTSITNDRLRQAGNVFLTDYYRSGGSSVRVVN